MTDKKFTDEEIIRNLTEFLIGAMDGYSAYLENGGIIDKNQEEYIEMLADGINLINRQKSEIEWLRGSTIINNIMNSQRIKREAKAEAYKEFAKRLENKIKTECNPYGKPTYDYDTSISILHYIDKLVEEMITDKE